MLREEIENIVNLSSLSNKCFRIDVRVANPRIPRYPRSTSSANRPSSDDDIPKALRNVGSVIAVSSCKGGVGKSTVAVHLAYSMARRGARVGILDADVYGPSLPTLVRFPTGENQLPLLREHESKLLRPAEVDSVKLMSYGFVAKGAAEGQPASAVVRGPIVSQMINSMTCGTKWGELDVLIVDLPPGTGDVVLTTCQTLAVTGAVVVTTPQELSHVDVVKGIDMFDKMNIPVASVVQNMSHFDTPNGQRYYPFGRGAMDVCALSNKLGLDDSVPVFSLPIRERLSTEIGVPLTSSRHVAGAGDHDDVANIFDEASTYLASWICERLASQRTSAPETVSSIAPRNGDVASRRIHIDDGYVFYDPKRESIVIRFLRGEREGTEHVASSIDLRLAGRDAKTTTDKALSKDVLAESSLRPVTIEPVGNYAVQISWSDGHTDGIYPFDLIASVSSDALSSSADK